MPNGSTAGATIEMASGDDGSLWVYLVEADKRVPIREVTWWADVDKEVECWIGVYAAKPAKEQESLSVKFEQLAVEGE
jgi:hypothetical protein